MNWLVLLYSIRSMATNIFHIMLSPKRAMIDHARPPTAKLTMGAAIAKTMKGRRRILMSFALVAFFLLSSGYVILIFIVWTPFYYGIQSLASEEAVHSFLKYGGDGVLGDGENSGVTIGDSTAECLTCL